MKVRPRQFDPRKAAVYAVVINALQIVAMLALALYLLIDDMNAALQGAAGDVLVLCLALVVIWGAAVDIREALEARHMNEQLGGLDDTVRQMTDLNQALRAQRHDFLNHLQVVYSLMEMQEYDEANRYIEQVYGDIQSLSQSMKTACAPVNALLRAKAAEAEKRGIAWQTVIHGAWKDLPFPAWEMCRVLSNLMDNAMDALAGQADARLTVTLSEDVHGFAFQVSNNGPVIPADRQRAIFEPGISSKGEGRGMGLFISRQTLEAVGGSLTLTSTAEETSFSGFVPRRNPIETPNEK